MAEYLIAVESAVIREGSRRHVIHRNKTVVRADDPIVKGREKLFRPLDRKVMLGSDVEQATAAPGERRAVRRRFTQDG
jgi:hypothetical protein